MRTNLPLLIFFAFVIGPASMAAANGWASGLNFVPVIEETVVTDENGNRMTLMPGTPVYVKPSDESFETWANWTGRPRNRRIQIDHQALPRQLAGFWTYQRSEFRRSTLMLESEAATETDPLVRSWKYILAAHSHLLADSADYSGAIRLYRLVARSTASAFRADAQHFVVRALLNQKKHSEALMELAALSRLLKRLSFQGGVLFSTYPLHVPVTAWNWGGGSGTEEALKVLDAFIYAKTAFASRENGREDTEDAEICYQLAMATENLWRVFPEKYFDDTRPWRMLPFLELTFKNYPATEAAAKAFYRSLDFQHFWDFDGEKIRWEKHEKELMESFLSRYPNSPPAEQARKRLEAANNYIESYDDRQSPAEKR